MRGKRVNTRLSVSQTARGTSCAMQWKYWYVDKLRPRTQSAALLFGTAVEAGINELVLRKPNEEVVAAFDKAWSFQKINSVYTHLPKCTHIVYAESDFDEDLLTEEDRQDICATFGIEADKLTEEIDRVYKDKGYQGFLNMPEDRREFLNYINWLCLYRKALFIFEAIREEFVPLIEKVYSIQEKVELIARDADGNPTGDTAIGYADMVVKLFKYDKPIVFDWKTSSREYDKDSVKTSIQLSVYLHDLSDKYENTRLAGYGVAFKHIQKNKKKLCTSCGKDGSGKNHKTCDADVDGKRCHGKWQITMSPKAELQILIDEIPEYTEQISLENMASFNQLIKNGVFIRNFDACVKPWGKCPFYGKCRENIGDVGLIKIESEERDEKVSPIANAG
jgi:hypothetical protein